MIEDDIEAAIGFVDRSDATTERLIAEIRTLRARLEIDPRHSVDGIDARDETIRGLEGEAQALRVDAELWRTEMRLRNDPTVAIMFAGVDNRCVIYRGGVAIAAAGTYAEAIAAAHPREGA